jgi:hypothetical protein
MRGLDIDARKGGASIFLSILGLLTIILSLFFLFLNNEFSAFGFVNATGGHILPIFENVWDIGVRVETGGTFGLRAGWAASLLVTVVQFLFWILDPEIVFKQDKWFKRIMIALIAYDFASTVYYLTTLGIETTPIDLWVTTISVPTISGMVSFGLILFISFAFLSIGSEWWLALGWTLFRLNFPEALAFIQEGWDSIDKALFSQSGILSQRTDRRIDQYKNSYQGRPAQPPSHHNNRVETAREKYEREQRQQREASASV